MCGIGGEFGAGHLLEEQRLVHRGKDAAGSWVGNEARIVHYLHAMVGHCPQPLRAEGQVFAANCEIYNWRELQEKYSVLGNNDAEVFFALLRSRGLAILEELDGDYAFAWFTGNGVVVGRDILGVKPLWIREQHGSFAFASEHAAIAGSSLLDPRVVARWDGALSVTQRPFFRVNEVSQTEATIIGKLSLLVPAAVRKRLWNGPIAVLFSGGIDSVLLAYLLKKEGADVHLYTAGVAGSDDVVWAQEAADWLGLPLSIAYPHEDEVLHALPMIKQIIGTDQYIPVSVAVPFYFALQQAAGKKLVMTGLGAEELFAGYQRHEQAADINAECLAGLLAIHERDLYRDDALAMYFGMELRLPFLDTKLTRYALTIPGKLKISGDVKKYIWRKYAASIGVPERFASRPKKAAQYGSGFDKMLEKLAKKKGVSKRVLVESL